MLEPSNVPGSKIQLKDHKDLPDLPLIPLPIVSFNKVLKFEMALTIFTAINGNEPKGPFRNVLEHFTTLVRVKSLDISLAAQWSFS